MNWRNPNKELPEDGQMVCVMLYPHKHRGTLRNSLPSVEIVAGEVDRYLGRCIVDNYDELGMGSIYWILAGEDDPYRERAIAWIPIEEMPLPGWWK